MTDYSPPSYARPHIQPLKKVTESVRERETFKYYPSLLNGAATNDSGQPTETSQLTSCDDAVLTALAQAGAFQTSTDRSLISLFDGDSQYIVAESSRTSRLQPSVKSEDCKEPLWLCGTAIPRSHGVCELSLLGEDGVHSENGNKPPELPLTLADDLVADNRFCMKPYCQPGTLCRFYAAVPIRTQRGINIGVYCVINETPGKVWNDEYTQRLRDISQTIMTHLESKRLSYLQRRSERMNRGLGSFIEGKSTLSGWQSSPNISSFLDVSESEGALNSMQQYMQLEQGAMEGVITGDGISPTTTSLDARLAHSRNSPLTATERSSRDDQQSQEATSSASEGSPSSNVWSKAANIIRESTEVEGCLYADATMEAYRSPSQTTTKGNPMEQWSGTSSSDDNSEQAPGGQEWHPCMVLGYSNSDKSSINGDVSKQASAAMPERFLAKLLRRYPKGKIFNFGADGLLQSSESSDDDGALSPTEPAASPQLNNGKYTSSNSTRDKTPNRPWARRREGTVILKAFPGARSVAFAPVWDPRKDRWYAGGFIYTNSPTRSFTVEGELSYLRALGMLTMVEILRNNDLVADKAKSDILGSLSHELRSPLHGVMLSAELLVDTKLSVFQGNVAHTIEVCSRTLLDTIDHLLDYSKINSLANGSKQIKPTSRFQASKGMGNLGQLGEKNLSCTAQLDGLVEEVVESVFAGHTFRSLSVTQLSNGRTGVKKINSHGSCKANPIETMARLDSLQSEGEELSVDLGNVLVILSVDARENWAYFVQLGAIRRIVMNIFGNALKYTQRGTIKVSLTQEIMSLQHRRKESVVKFTVQDTGKGIGADFIRHGLFRPFSQEDTLSPGTGLGLSLVKQIVSQLQGEVSISSQVGVGTTVTVALPLQRQSQHPEAGLSNADDNKKFTDQIQDLKGLRIGLLLCKDQQKGNVSEWHNLVAKICHEWLLMEVVTETSGVTTPDLLLWGHDVLSSSTREPNTFSKTPNVVICSNSLTAYHESALFEEADHPAVFEFISQPIGPRKLAQALLLAYTRWMDISDSPTRAYATTVSAPRLDSSMVPNSLGIYERSRPAVARGTSFPHSVSSMNTDDDVMSGFSSGKDGTSGESTSNDSPPPKNPTPAPKFLLVDDNHINLKVLSTYMKKLGLGYDTAMNGKEATDLFCLHACTYSCVLMDISMPIMDGFEATRHIRAYEGQNSLKQVPIIALSGLASEDAQREALGSGMDLFLTKPVKLRALGNLLESMGIINAQ